MSQPMEKPTAEFERWWNPTSHNVATGAQTGGHPEARRKCVNVETRQVQYYGISAFIAFNLESYRQEYRKWIRDGMQPHAEKADGTALSQKDAIDCLRYLKTLLAEAPCMEKIPRATKAELDHERKLMSKELHYA